MNALEFDAWLKEYANGLDCKPLVMGILNVTPDSFSDGGKYESIEKALARAHEMFAQGVDIIDIGGESTRPGAQKLNLDTELKRVIPVVSAIRSELDICISIDSYKSEVMEAAIQVGADVINDVYALAQPGALEVALKYQKPVCLMHSFPELHARPSDENQVDLFPVLHHFFVDRLKELLDSGLDRTRLIIDPGIGFGKTTPQNLFLIRHLNRLKTLQCPVMLGVSKKRMIKDVLNKSTDELLYGSLTVNLMGYLQGCRIFRTHDIMPTIDALKMADAVMSKEFLYE